MSTKEVKTKEEEIDEASHYYEINNPDVDPDEAFEAGIRWEQARQSSIALDVHQWLDESGSSKTEHTAESPQPEGEKEKFSADVLNWMIQMGIKHNLRGWYQDGIFSCDYYSTEDLLTLYKSSLENKNNSI